MSSAIHEKTIGEKTFTLKEGAWDVSKNNNVSTIKKFKLNTRGQYFVDSVLLLNVWFLVDF